MSDLDFSIKETERTHQNPSMTLVGGSKVHEPTIAGAKLGTFTGTVWLDRILSGSKISVADVNFAPGARTNWHRHEGGQLLRVTAGSGWICDQGGKPQRIHLGDVIWCPAGSVHWHGADDGNYMVHQAVTLGDIDWYDPVTDQEYSAKV